MIPKHEMIPKMIYRARGAAWRIVALLHEREMLNLTSIANELDISKVTIKQVVQDMEHFGIVKLTPIGQSKVVSLTDSQTVWQMLAVLDKLEESEKR